LRLTLAANANSVCVDERGCAGAPRGSIRILPLEPAVRTAVADTLAAAGFELVAADADAVVEVEWRGTDTIRLGVRDVHGQLLEQVSYRRSLEQCKTLTDTRPESCWAANFERMRTVLSQPLQNSEALRALARRSRAGTSDAPVAGAGSVPAPPAETGPAVPQLGPSEIQDTVSRYRDHLRRACWMSALEARVEGAPSSARVSTSVTINASGVVDDVTVGAEPVGYAGLSACVASHVRGWRFPRSQQAATTIDIPFVFASE
jgi:hypothetical protein